VTRRTTLRPAEPSPYAGGPPPADEAADAGPSPPPAAMQSSPLDAIRRIPTAILAVGFVLGGVVILMAVANLSGDRAKAPAPQATEPSLATEPSIASEPNPVATANPCPSIGSWLDVIATYERQARWGLAASSAQTALRTPGLCEADRGALGQKAVALSKQALFESPPPPEDAAGQRRVAAAYGDLKALAAQNGMPPPPPLQIARSAYDARLFVLASAAFADAFTSGESSVEDRDVVRAAYATQRNIGLIWSQRADSGQRQEGLARLVTACRIDELDQLGSPEACDDLKTLLGPREKWPPPLPDPLIDTLPPPAQARGL
jgi:hypothetical protein